MSERDLTAVPSDPFADHTGELRRLREDLEGRYQLERELGGGGMSRVFLALDPSLGRQVVIKVLHPGLAASLSLERFKREVMVVAGLQHPNIVPVLAAGEGGGLPYFIMPFIAGESLRERLIRGPLSVRETVSIMKDVARALAYAHDRGIVHRDIKPGNILVTAGAAVVTDFGVAKALNTARVSQPGRALPPSSTTKPQTLTQLGTSLGTPAYMAPEQAAGDPATDHRADIYALGVVAWEMLVGTPPFHGRSPQALLTAQLSETPPAIATRRYDVPSPLHALIMRCLEKNADMRPRTAAELLRALEDPELLSGSYATPPTAGSRNRRKRRREWVALGAAVVAVGALAGWWAMRSRATTAADPTAAAPLVVSPPPGMGRALAVLPLAPIGRDAQASDIADGVTSEMTTQVAGIPRLRVASGTAVATLRDRRAAPAEIARLLGVSMVVEGTVQREGSKVRISLRLVSAQNDSTIWSDTFDGERGATLALQDRVAKALVAAIAPRLSAQ